MIIARLLMINFAHFFSKEQLKADTDFVPEEAVVSLLLADAAQPTNTTIKQRWDPVDGEFNL